MEEQALDSFANVLFSILRFWRETGNFPEKVTIVSHAFKEDRLMELHIPAIRFPRERVLFVGIDPEYMRIGHEAYDEERTASVLRASSEKGYAEWKKDLLGCGDSLSGKRAARNPWGVSQVWFDSREDRERSGVKSMLKVGEEGLEEFLTTEKQPWENEQVE